MGDGDFLKLLQLPLMFAFRTRGMVDTLIREIYNIFPNLTWMPNLPAWLGLNCS
jgi:hypothetical protein